MTSGVDTASAQDLQSLRVGLMPAVDAAPFFVARSAGYFTEAGLDVTFDVFTSGQDRQAALQSGRIDGAMTDLVAVVVNVAGGFDVRATMLTDGVFPVLAQPGATAEQALRVGTMEVSVTNFLIDEWLSDYRMEKVFVTSIPARLEALAAGQLDMAIFPEPIASVGAARGLEKLLFDPVDGYSPDVMVFTGAARREKARELELFHRAYDRAAADLIADPDLARDALLGALSNLDPGIRDAITLPDYRRAQLPPNAYLQRIIDWTAALVPDAGDVVPADLVDRSFVD